LFEGIPIVKIGLYPLQGHYPFLHGEPGQPLTLAVENESGTLHNLSISELQIDQDIPPQATAKVQVTFP
jgi:hypothetical protein